MLLKSAQEAQGFVIGESFKSAWEIFKKEWIVVYAVQFLPFVFGILYSVLMENVDQNSGANLLWTLVYMAIQFILSMGVINAYLQITRGKKVTMETFTSIVTKIVNYFVAQILMILIVLGGFLLFIIPGIYFSLKFMYAPYLVIDKGMGPIEALKASGQITHGVKWDMIGFMAAAAILMYSGILALFVGLLVTMPVATLSYVILYNKLAKRL